MHLVAYRNQAPAVADTAAGAGPEDLAWRRPSRSVRRGRVGKGLGAMVAVTALLTSACSGNRAAPSGGTSSGESASPVPSSTTSSPNGVEVTFDSRPGTKPGPAFSNVINVYPGPRATPEDKHANGTFKSGQITTAICEATGRPVQTHSEQPFGEQPGVSSNKWAEILAGGQTYFATFVYLSNASDAAANHLPPCTDAP